MKIHCFQHVPFEGLGEIARWALAGGSRMGFTRLFEKPQWPAPGSVDFLIVMGGPMNVYEYRQYPWLRAEKEFISHQVDRGIPVLGVCLGAQLLADVLGAKVYQNPEKEIGWMPIRWRALPATRRLLGRDPGEMTVFHWHGDTFDLPPKAECLAESAACPHQAFVCRRRVVGLQFHLEVGPEEVSLMAKHGAGELTGGRLVQTAEDLARVPPGLNDGYALLRHLLDRMTDRSL
jgi:GMP synthase-like glutamine amidotransferase